jgi:Na+-transporting methylmalonyl-CoA/oxaloacetate decarboxylase gamma subunit
MTEQIGVALQITVVGMGLVFGAIVLLWLGMALLVKVTADPVAIYPSGGTPEATPVPDGHAVRSQAAAIAVAVALAEQKAGQHQNILPSTATISPWQSVMRGRQFRQRGPVR